MYKHKQGCSPWALFMDGLLRWFLFRSNKFLCASHFIIRLSVRHSATTARRRHPTLPPYHPTAPPPYHSTTQHTVIDNCPCFGQKKKTLLLKMQPAGCGAKQLKLEKQLELEVELELELESGVGIGTGSDTHLIMEMLDFRRKFILKHYRKTVGHFFCNWNWKCCWKWHWN